MFEKLDALLLHYEEIGRNLMSPDIAQDQARFRALMKEQSDLTPIVETYTAYKKAEESVSDAQMILEEEKDEEMR